MELSSGYILSAFDSIFKTNPTLKDILSRQCNFQVKSNLFGSQDIEIDDETAIIAVLHNIILRGFPTYSSYFIEKRIAENSEFLTIDDDKSGITVGAKLSGIESKRLIEEISFISGPTSYLREQQKKSADSQFEASLIPLLEDEFGEWISNTLCQQISFSEIAPNALDLKEQRVDYLLPFPVKISDLQGFVIEMDGPQHQTYGETDLDTRRENIALKQGYGTIRIRSSDSNAVKRKKIRQIKKYLNPDIFHLYQEKKNTPYKQESETLVLKPLAYARIQLCVMKAVLNNCEWLKDSVIRIAIIERDISDLALAVEDLNHWFSHFSVVTGATNLPIFECECFGSQEEIEDFDQFHTIVDISLKSRFSDIESVEYPNAIVIRNSPLYSNSVRKIVTGPHVEYQQFGVYENSKWELRKPDIVQSLTYFLRSLFRKKDFKDGQLPILNRSLASQSVIGLLPTGGGKSLTYQLSALLQPGVCMVIDPIISLMRDQVTGLRNHWIDACDFLNSSIKTREEREKVQKRISEGASIFFFVSPERLLIKGFREKLQDMSLNHPAIYFSYCVIDEAHCVSEWGHDFRTSYLSVAENSMRFCITKKDSTIPLFALTATASYDVLTDIQRELSGNDLEFRIGEESIIELDDYTRPELNFQIVSINPDDLRNERDFNLKRIIAERKNEVLYNLISNHKEVLNSNAGLVFCPHRSHYFGVTDRFKNNGFENVGVLDVLERKLPSMYHRMGFFMGSGDDHDIVQELSIQNQDQFIEGKINLLVATKAFGMGIDKNNIRFTVHYNYPGSIESFLQEAGRAGRDEDPANCYLLYTPPNQLKEDIENDVNQYFHSNAYRGAEKEKEIISELLYKIFEPDRTYDIKADIKDEFNLELSVSIWEYGDGKFISLHDENRIGKIKINPTNREIFPDPPFEINGFNYTAEISNRLLEYVNNKIRPIGNPQEIWEWLNSSGGTREGILNVLNSGRCTQEKYSGTLELAWENNIRERIMNIQKFVIDSLRIDGREFQDSYVENLIQESIQGKKSALNFDDLIEKINTGLSNYNYDLIEQAKKRDTRKQYSIGSTIKGLKNYYNQVRDKADTEKAIYRLRLLGVIDDYTVDYRTQMFTLYLSKKDDQYYKDRLSNYLSKFYADERVNKEMARVEKTEGENQIHKYLNYLVDFGYEQIAKKRKHSIDDMKGACEYGIKESITSDQLADYLNLYLNSKYSRVSYLVDEKNESLPHNLNNGKVTDSKFIWHYIELMAKDTNGEISNLKHLRGAALKLRLDWVENPVLSILASYATYVLEFTTPSLLTEAENNLMAGLDFYENQEEWSEEMLRDLFDELVKKIRLKRPEIDKYYQFEFENFRLSAVHRSLQNINSSMSDINLKINTHA